MSPGGSFKDAKRYGFPRVSGDEPFLYGSFDRYLGFSRRKRG